MPRWLIWTLLTLLLWGLWGFLSKVVGDRLTAEHCQAISTLGMIPVLSVIGISPATWLSQGPRRAIRRGDLLAFGGGLVSCLGSIAFFGVLAGGAKAATAISLTALAPLITVVLALPILHERLNRIQWTGIVLSVAAFYFLNVRSEEGILSRWLLQAMVPILLWGVAGLFQKMATNSISGLRSAFWFLMAFIPIGLFIVVRHPLTNMIPREGWLSGVAVGFFLALGNVTILFAFASDGKASVIAPLAGLYPLVSIPLAMWLLHERLTGRESIGIAMALAAVVALCWESPRSEPPSP